MSTPSTKSPTQRWLSNDDQSAAPRRSSENVSSSQAASPEPVIASTGSGDHAPPMNYPIDENLFYSAPSQPLADALNAEVQEIEQTAQDEPKIEELPHPPDFKPFFTLIEEPETGIHHHPTVHYIFSDDDPEILTNAALEALHEPAQHEDHADERYVIVDMAADGKTIMSVASLSKEWQALHTSLAQALSWGNDSNHEDRGLMLKISGQEQRRVGHGKERRRSLQGADNVDDLVAAFGKTLDGLDEVLGRSEELAMEHKDIE